jgi:hypothetical protein
MKKIWIYIFLIYKTSIKIMDDRFTLTLNSYKLNFPHLVFIN